MIWPAEVFDPARTWLHSLRTDDPDTLQQISAAIKVLRETGPTLNEPLVKPVKTSQFGEMRELRPGSAKNTEIRLLFAWDPRRTAVFFVGGNKAGNWDRWYLTNVPLADRLYQNHLDNINKNK